jgi:hypothetical protein
MGIRAMGMGTAVAGMPVLPSTATATADTGPTGPCMATIGLTGATGIGVTKNAPRLNTGRFTDRAATPQLHYVCLGPAARSLRKALKHQALW